MSQGKPFNAALPEDLAIRARRGELSADERTALSRALAADPELELAHRLGLDFDRASRVRAGDDVLIQNATRGALARTGARGRRRPRAVLLVAAGVLVGATATAAVALFNQRPPAVFPPAPSSFAPSPSVRAAMRPAPVPPAPSSAAESTPSAPAPRSSPKSTKAAEVSVPTLAPAPSAEELFRDANAARRSGDLGLAMLLYRELQSSFPGSREAQISHVSLGRLLLSADRATEAERQFRAYAATGGELWEEAAAGRAEALARLGQTTGEARVWQELLDRHPASVYAARARQRLSQLGIRESNRTPNE
jgi:TolA-binding protein